MTTTDTCCSINPYFKVHANKLDAFKEICQQLVEKARKEPKCLYYGFSFNNDRVHCREGFEGAEGILTHLENISALLNKALEISDLISLEIHGIDTEIDKLREPLSDLNPKFYNLRYGFRR
jgi:quinol monooxygenase YgiN